ncbi:MAG: hypothetical protein ACWA5P_00645 [bacterium]
MRNLLFITALILTTTFSCTTEEITLNDNSNDLPLLVLNNEGKNSSYTSGKTAADINVCRTIPLISPTNEKVGFVDFGMAYNQVIITYRTTDNAKIKDISLSLREDISNDFFPTNTDGSPNIEAFEIRESFNDAVNTVTYYIDQDYYANDYSFATMATLEIDEEYSIETWSHGNRFDNSNFAMYSSIAAAKCGAVYETCEALTDINMFIPLHANTSGVYPEQGQEAEVISLNPMNSSANGFLEIPLTFDISTEKFGNTTLSISFEDLDLEQKIINAYGNSILFYETLELRDENRNLLTTLDHTHAESGNFNWEYRVSNEMFIENPSEITFYVVLNAHLELQSGSGIQIQNTIEAMRDIKLCGSKMGGIE